MLCFEDTIFGCVIYVPVGIQPPFSFFGVGSGQNWADTQKSNSAWPLEDVALVSLWPLTARTPALTACPRPTGRAPAATPRAFRARFLFSQTNRLFYPLARLYRNRL